MTKPSKGDLAAVLRAAGAAHHDYQTHFLKGAPDPQWPGWYAAYALGRLGDFTTPTQLAGWLEGVEDDDWAEAAAAAVLARRD